MRILVVSDSHGDVFGLRCAIEAQPTASVLIHLGDGERDMDAVSGAAGNIKVIRVKGNADYSTDIPYNCVEIIEGKRIYCTHGQWEKVKYGDYELICAAKDAGADLVLFGHTHTPAKDYIDGIYLFNPGSIRDGNYGVIDITKAGIVCIHMKLMF